MCCWSTPHSKSNWNSNCISVNLTKLYDFLVRSVIWTRFGRAVSYSHPSIRWPQISGWNGCALNWPFPQRKWNTERSTNSFAEHLPTIIVELLCWFIVKFVWLYIFLVFLLASAVALEYANLLVKTPSLFDTWEVLISTYTFHCTQGRALFEAWRAHCLNVEPEYAFQHILEFN